MGVEAVTGYSGPKRTTISPSRGCYHFSPAEGAADMINGQPLQKNILAIPQGHRLHKAVDQQHGTGSRILFP